MNTEKKEVSASDVAPTQTAAPLAGLRIIDISSVMSAPFATLALADHGADVIKIETLDGDIMRQSGRSPEPAMSPIFQHLNHNKRSIALDLKRSEGIDVLRKLLNNADALVYNMRPVAMKRLGLDYACIKTLYPRLIHCGVVGYGQNGRYASKPAYDDLIQGASAIPDLVGKSLRCEPRYIPLALTDRLAGLYTANALLAALWQRERTGQGCAIELAMFECAAHFSLVEHMMQRSFSAVQPAINPRMMEPNRRPFATKDGHVSVLPYTNKHWESLFTLMERPDLLQDVRFKSFESRRENITELYDFLAAHLVERTTAEWLEALNQADIPATRANTIDELLDDPHLWETGFFRLADTSDGGKAFVHLSQPSTWSNWTAPLARPAPRISEHAVEILREAGFDEGTINGLIRAGVTFDAGSHQG